MAVHYEDCPTIEILVAIWASIAMVVTDVFQINWFSVRDKTGKIAKIFVKTEDPENRGVI